MAIRERHGSRGTRYAAIFQNVGVQTSETFPTREQAEDYERWATEQIIVTCRCKPKGPKKGPRRLRMSRASLADGKIICGICNEPFTEPEPQDTLV